MDEVLRAELDNLGEARSWTSPCVTAWTKRSLDRARRKLLERCDRLSDLVRYARDRCQDPRSGYVYFRVLTRLLVDPVLSSDVAQLVEADVPELARRLVRVAGDEETRTLECGLQFLLAYSKKTQSGSHTDVGEFELFARKFWTICTDASVRDRHDNVILLLRYIAKLLENGCVPHSTAAVALPLPGHLFLSVLRSCKAGADATVYGLMDAFGRFVAAAVCKSEAAQRRALELGLLDIFANGLVNGIAFEGMACATDIWADGIEFKDAAVTPKGSPNELDRIGLNLTDDKNRCASMALGAMSAAVANLTDYYGPTLLGDPLLDRVHYLFHPHEPAAESMRSRDFPLKPRVVTACLRPGQDLQLLASSLATVAVLLYNDKRTQEAFLLDTNAVAFLCTAFLDLSVRASQAWPARTLFDEGWPARTQFDEGWPARTQFDEGWGLPSPAHTTAKESSALAKSLVGCLQALTNCVFENPTALVLLGKPNDELVKNAVRLTAILQTEVAEAAVDFVTAWYMHGTGHRAAITDAVESGMLTSAVMPPARTLAESVTAAGPGGKQRCIRAIVRAAYLLSQVCRVDGALLKTPHVLSHVAYSIAKVFAMARFLDSRHTSVPSVTPAVPLELLAVSGKALRSSLSILERSVENVCVDHKLEGRVFEQLMDVLGDLHVPPILYFPKSGNPGPISLRGRCRFDELRVGTLALTLTDQSSQLQDQTDVMDRLMEELLRRWQTECLSLSDAIRFLALRWRRMAASVDGLDEIRELGSCVEFAERELRTTVDAELRIALQMARAHGLRVLGQLLVECGDESQLRAKNCLIESENVCSALLRHDHMRSSASLLEDRVQALVSLASMAANAGDFVEMSTWNLKLESLSRTSARSLAHYKGPQHGMQPVPKNKRLSCEACVGDGFPACYG